MKALFDDYFLIKKATKTSVRARLASQGTMSTSYFLLIVLTFLLGPIIIYYWPMENFILKLFLLIPSFIASYFVVNKFIKPYMLTLPILVINKDKTSIETPLDKFHTTFTDIKTIAIIEEQHEEIPDQKMYRLKLTLTDGEKTLDFAFTSYNKLDEILNEIKKST